MTITHARADESGELVLGYFFELFVTPPWLPITYQSSEWIVSGSNEKYAHASVVNYDTRERHDCRVDPTHVNCNIEIARDVELFEWPIDKLICEDTVLLVDERLAIELQHSPLRGVEIRPVALVNLEEFRREKPKVFTVLYGGPGVQRCSCAPKEGENSCPFCGFGPLFCRGCQHRYHICPRCSRHATVLISEDPVPSDPRIRFHPAPPLGHVVDPRLWDGTDLLGGGVITRRALDWLLSVHAEPFRARPLRTDISALTRAEHERLEQTKVFP